MDGWNPLWRGAWLGSVMVPRWFRVWNLLKNASWDGEETGVGLFACCFLQVGCADRNCSHCRIRGPVVEIRLKIRLKIRVFSGLVFNIIWRSNW